ncbi:MAG: ribbon-helix-helix protein, CopG family [Nitrospirota bacterium]|nr:ribbon-helix-helix protein, CopG family [Nitrospirota bacterium]
MIRTQIQLTENQAETIRKIAKSRHLSVAELIRQAVDNLIRSTVLVDIEERRKRAIEAAGRFSSGLSDLSAEHDKYLEEAFSD